MPCRVDETPQEIAQRRADRNLKAAEKALKQAEAKYAALLCGACRVLDRLEYDFDENPELSTWWDAHKRKDAAREKREGRKAWVAKQAALLMDRPLSELDEDERKILKEAGVLK